MQKSLPKDFKLQPALEFAIHEALLDGGAPLSLGRLNLVGQGRAGKTALSRSLQGLCFQDTPSTAGVEHQLMDIDCASLEVVGASCSWRRSASMDCSGAVSAAQVAAQAAAKKLSFCQDAITPQLTEMDKIESAEDKLMTQSAGESASPSADESLVPAVLSAADHELVLQLASVDGTSEAVKLRLSLWDFGGQEVFYALHHLYLTRFAAYAVLFNMEVRIRTRMYFVVSN